MRGEAEVQRVPFRVTRHSRHQPYDPMQRVYFTVGLFLRPVGQSVSQSESGLVWMASYFFGQFVSYFLS